MNSKPGLVTSHFFFPLLSLFIISCGKGGGGSTPAPNPCSGITVTVTATVNNPGSPGANNGSISAAATGGSGFTYNLNGGPFQSSGIFANLSAGSYSITAKNSNGCTGTSAFTLTAPDPCPGVIITVSGTSINPSAPGANNGSISASASGGTLPHSFSLNGGAFQSSGIFSGLTAGIYTVTVRDANACTGSTGFTLVDPDPCAGVTIIAGTNITSNTPCASPPTGTITVLPSGGVSPYTYSLNGGTFQPSGVFSNLPASNYTVTVKDANNCTGTATATVNNLAQGPLFSQVKTLIQANCVPCHNTVSPNGGMNFEVDCNIVSSKDRVVARAVNANPSAMPPTGLLPASERQKIIDWVNAGGRYTD